MKKSTNHLLRIVGSQVLVCSYGENAWQNLAVLYATKTADPLSIDKFSLIQGAAISYNGLCDLDRLIQTITHTAAAFEVNGNQIPFIALGAKHGNACGAGIGSKPEAIKRMVEGDPRAIFGGMVITNFPLTLDLTKILLTHAQPSGRRLLDGVIAPQIYPDAMAMLTRKFDKCRLFVNPALETLGVSSLDTSRRIRYVRGGFLVQPNYTFVLNLDDSSIKKIGDLNSEQKDSLLLAWAIGSTSNSNTVTLVKNGQLISNGVGQQDRVSASQLAIKRALDAKHDILGAVAYSDSFFPFPDGPQVLASAGVKAIMASSGSINDEKTRQVCLDNGVSLRMIPDKMGRGFFGH